MRAGLAIFAACTILACRPRPWQPATAPQSVNSAHSSQKTGQRFYRDGALHVRIAHGIARINGENISLDNTRHLEEVLAASDLLTWKLSPTDDATGLDVLTVLRAGTVADFEIADFSPARDAPLPVRSGYTKPGWHKLAFPAPPVVLEITKESVVATSGDHIEFSSPLPGSAGSLKETLHKFCSETDHCLGLIIAMDNDAPAQALQTLLPALFPGPMPVLISKADLENTIANNVEYPKLPAKNATGGTLPPVVIQQIVREQYAQFRQCFEDGLRRNHNLEGRVTVRFVIGTDGTVSDIHALPPPLIPTSPRPSFLGTTMPDPSVTDCVVQHYRPLKFPHPEGGIVTVVYPIMFSPG
jgi:hypothetical protein